MKHKFEPSKISVDEATGHFYHPAPVRLRLPNSLPPAIPPPATDSRSRRSERTPPLKPLDDANVANTPANQVLSVALLRSQLILDHFEVTDDGEGIVWKGKRYPIS